jgi:RNA polymerase sigma-B factor
MTAPEGRGPGKAVASSDLFRRWQDRRDFEARDELVRRYMPLVRKLAARYIRSSEPFDDLVQVASLGLVKAVDRFDPDRGVAFTSYAVPTIVGELKRYFRDLGWTLHIERGAKERAAQVAEARSTLSMNTGRSPTVGELAQYLERSVDEVIDGLQVWAATDTVSLDEPVTLNADGRPVPRVETVGACDAELDLVDDRVAISVAARHLPELERKILYLRYGEDLTQTEIADRVDISQMHVSRLQRRALERLATLIRGREAAA